MAVVGYARVSTEDQDLEVQIEQLKDAGCTKIFAEKITGTTRERPELAKCLGYVRDGDTLVVTRIDRLARSTQDFGNILADLKEREVAFRCVLQPIDSTGPTGVLMMQMLAAFAEFETALRRERQMEGIAKAKERGVYKRTYHGRKPQEWGYVSKLLKQGMSYVQVEEITGIAEDSIRRKFPEYTGNFKRGRPKGSKTRKPRSPAAVRAAQAEAATHPPSAAERSPEPVASEPASKKPGFLGNIFGPR